MKIALIVLAVVVGLAIAVEVGLRAIVGFGNPPIYLPDDKIGYRLAPNQGVRRFGNRMEINEYSMRSPAITPVVPENTWRVLLLGDSVANGGWWTDQDDTISALMTQELKSELVSESGSALADVEVYNASANSWGPRNELAYLQRFGMFGAQVLVLTINTDDLFGRMPASLVVGRDRNYPARKPPFAIAEAFTRYILPAPAMPSLPEEKGDLVGKNIEAIRQIHQLARENNSKFLLAMTPLRRELGEPGPRDYEVKLRQRLQEFTQQQQIEYIDFLPQFNAVEQGDRFYRDHIHLSPKGNEFVARAIGNALIPFMNTSPPADARWRCLD